MGLEGKVNEGETSMLSSLQSGTVLSGRRIERTAPWMPLWAACPPLSVPSWGKGFSPSPEPWWDLLSHASSVPHLGGPYLRSSHLKGRAPIWGRAQCVQTGPGSEKSFSLSCFSFSRTCLWTGNGTWSPTAQLLRPRAQHLGVAAPPAHQTWARKAEWPAEVPLGWKPQSLSATHSMTRSPPVGVRVEGLRHGPPSGAGDHRLDWLPSGPAPGGQWSPSLKGPRRQMDKKKWRESLHTPLPTAAVEEMTALSSGRGPTCGPSSHPE